MVTRVSVRLPTTIAPQGQFVPTRTQVETFAFIMKNIDRIPKRLKFCEVIRRCSNRFRRSEEHTSELQSLMRISYAVFCLKKKTNIYIKPQHVNNKPAID